MPLGDRCGHRIKVINRNRRNRSLNPDRGVVVRVHIEQFGEILLRDAPIRNQHSVDLEKYVEIRGIAAHDLQIGEISEPVRVGDNDVACKPGEFVGCKLNSFKYGG